MTFLFEHHVGFLSKGQKKPPVTQSRQVWEKQEAAFDVAAGALTLFPTPPPTHKGSDPAIQCVRSQKKAPGNTVSQMV